MIGEASLAWRGRSQRRPPRQSSLWTSVAATLRPAPPATLLARWKRVRSRHEGAGLRRVTTKMSRDQTTETAASWRRVARARASLRIGRRHAH
eukprot:2795633-Prymnesium_polylepis.1